MADVDINDLASLGAISDVPAYQLPPEAWTSALNMRYSDGAPEALQGWTQVFGTPGAAPHFHMHVATQAANFWLYASTAKIWVYDGATHADISRTVGGAYNQPETASWNGTILGGIPLLNNGADVPQYRADMAAGTKFENLPNWPVNLRTKVLRAFGPFLMAVNVTDTGVSQPHTLRWSHPADPGTVPSSWDYTDATKDAGLKNFEDVQSGILVDAMPLRGTFYVYKQNSTWRGNSIGGRDKFDWKALYETSGILAPRCVVLSGDGERHVVATQDDVIYHSGGEPVSIVDKRQRSAIFSEMDAQNYVNSFLFSYPLMNEVWFCYPTSGNTHPNKAMIWNYKEGGERGVVSFADGITFRNASVGNIEGASSAIWDSGTDTWNDGVEQWSDFLRRRVVAAGTAATKFYNLDQGTTRDGVAFTSTLQRQGLSILGRKRSGEWIVNHQVRKMLQRLWPKIQGGPVTIRLGSQEEVKGPILWGNAVVYDPALSRVADNDPVSGAALAIEVSANSTPWRIDGYQASIAQLGSF